MAVKVPLSLQVRSSSTLESSILRRRQAGPEAVVRVNRQPSQPTRIESILKDL